MLIYVAGLWAVGGPGFPVLMPWLRPSPLDHEGNVGPVETPPSFFFGGAGPHPSPYVAKRGGGPDRTPFEAVEHCEEQHEWHVSEVCPVAPLCSGCSCAGPFRLRLTTSDPPSAKYSAPRCTKKMLLV